MKKCGPICIFNPKEKEAPALPDLDELFSGDILDRKVVVISVAGRFRQGKSLLMNFIIQYLKANGASQWMTDLCSDGFLSKHSRKPVTVGVLIWPEVFKIQDASGEEVVVVLIDTQGVFDTKTTVKDCTSIFSLSVLLSSIQIFNVKQNIQGDDLSQLELFTEFGRLVCSKSSNNSAQTDLKPFQDLIFLVRDWAYPHEAPYGWKGGQEILDQELGRADVTGELASMRASIKNCFESATCFLMPHPGETVDTSSEFKGALTDINPKMVKYLKCFIEDLLKPSKLKPKRVHGKELTLRDFLVFVEIYVREMRSDKLPTPQTMYDATVSATNSAVVSTCFEMYQAQVSALISGNPQEPARFEELHDSVLKNVFSHFDQSTMMGGKGKVAAAFKGLKAQIAAVKPQFVAANSAAHNKRHFDQEIARLQEDGERVAARISESCRAQAELRRWLEETRAENERLKVEARRRKREKEKEEMLRQAEALRKQEEISRQMQKHADEVRRLEEQEKAAAKKKQEMLAASLRAEEERNRLLREARRKKGPCSIF